VIEKDLSMQRASFLRGRPIAEAQLSAQNYRYKELKVCMQNTVDR